MSQDKFTVLPTLMNYKIIENKLKNAKIGHRLLTTKRDALNMSFEKIKKQIDSRNENINEIFQKAFLTLSKAEFYGANTKILKKKTETNVEIETTIENVCGLTIPKFSLIKNESMPKHVLSKGGHILMKAKKQFDDMLNLLVETSSLNNSYEILKTMCDTTKKKVNILEYVMIPKLERTLCYIRNEIDEKERENFYKLKKIQKINKEKNI